MPLHLPVSSQMHATFKVCGHFGEYQRWGHPCRGRWSLWFNPSWGVVGDGCFQDLIWVNICDP